MRPLRIDLAVFRPSEAVTEGDPVALLIDAFGAYCAVCERPTRERLFAWDPRTGGTVTAASDLGFSTLLPLCWACHQAQLGSTARLETLALPISDLDYGIRSPRLFEIGPHADVRPGGLAPKAAAATIRYFQLNVDGDDPRRFHRARAISAADRAARRIASGADPDLSAITELMTLTGHLSIWIDRFARTFNDAGPILDLLQLGLEDPEFFPGTDWAALGVEALTA